MNLLNLLAQTTSPSTQPTPPGWYQFMNSSTMPLIFGLLLLYVFMFRKRGADKGLEDKLKNLKRGDRIQTIGGILGTVVDAREDEVVVKVDETSNTKITFARKAIAGVVEDKTSAKS